MPFPGCTQPLMPSERPVPLCQSPAPGSHPAHTPRVTSECLGSFLRAPGNGFHLKRCWRGADPSHLPSGVSSRSTYHSCFWSISCASRKHCTKGGGDKETRGEAVSGLCFVICETQWFEYVSYNTCHGIEEAGPSVTSEERNLRTKTWGWEYPAVQTQESYTLGAVQANTPTVASRMKMLYRKGSYRFERNGQPWTDFKMWVRVMDTHHCYAIKCPRCCCQLQSTLERKLLS